MNEYNNENTLRQFSGKIWITKGELGKGGKNICARFDNGEFFVIAFISNKQQLDLLASVKSAILAMGWNPSEWL